MTTTKGLEDLVDTYGPLKNELELKVTYPNGRVVSHGSHFFLPDAAATPNVEIVGGDPNAVYTLVYCDPDAFARATPLFREVRHWIVTNIHNLDVAKGEQAEAHRGPGAPAGSGPHRYVFFLYKQQGPHKFEPFSNVRRNWDLPKWVKENNLTGPLATTFIYGENGTPPIETLADVYGLVPKPEVEISVSLGSQHLKLAQFVIDPSANDAIDVKLSGADSASFYTLVMTAPDIPSRLDPKEREQRHWIVSNIPGNDVSKGEVVESPLGVKMSEAGISRVVFLVYKQQGKQTIDKSSFGNSRTKWDHKLFASQNNLGSLVGITYFNSVSAK